MHDLITKFYRDLLIILLGISGLAVFFLLYPSQHPHSSIQVDIQKDEAVVIADSILRSWNLQTENFKKSAELSSLQSVLDSLQRKWGKQDFRKKMNIKNPAYRILYFWEVEEVEVNEEEQNNRRSFSTNFSGELTAFDLSTEYIENKRPFNRHAIRYVLQHQVENFNRDLEDSLVAGLLDYQHLGDESQSDTRSLQIIDKLRRLRGGEEDDIYTHNNIYNLADFYLQQTAWKHFDLSRDSVELKDNTGFQFARVHFSGSEEVSGLEISLSMDLLPAGSLKSISAEITPEYVEENEAAETLRMFSILVVVIFCLWLLVVFYLRIKAKAIDTKPAIIVAILTGFIAPAYLGLFLLREAEMYLIKFSFTDIINNLIFMAVFGAISAVLFFVLTAVSDSVTRQYSPEKLKTWDLIRRGIFKNKPVGWVIVHGFAAGGILAGIWTLLLYLFPTGFIAAELNLISDTYFLAPIANFLSSVFLVMLLVVPIYLILVNQISGASGKIWLIPIISGLVFGLISIVPVTIQLWYLDVLMNILIGAFLGYFYLRFDFLTTAFAAFMFINLLLTEDGFIILNSPDSGVFQFFMYLSLALVICAIYLILKGSEREELPEYVPEYIEEQAMEQRIRQELNIARVVQQAFLPSQIKRLPGIDIAGICIPAQETGGDYYDMISLGTSRTAIAIGDVSGKGIRAAFYMTFVKGVLHSLSPLILSPVELLNQLNRLFLENATRGTFISMIYGVLEADKRQFTFARAGHNPMLVVRREGKSEWIQPNGVGIGVAKGDTFLGGIEESVLKIKEGDVVVLYTDGITEMLDAGDRFYGEERLEKLVNKMKGNSSSEILKTIIADVNEFRGLAKQHDDMTLVIIKADASVTT